MVVYREHLDPTQSVENFRYKWLINFFLKFYICFGEFSAEEKIPFDSIFCTIDPDNIKYIMQRIQLCADEKNYEDLHICLEAFKEIVIKS